MRLSDISILGEHNRRAFWLSPVNEFLVPRAPEHPEQLDRQFRQGIRKRYVNPNSLSVVACLASNPAYPIGYAQFARLGDDEGAKEWVRQKGLLWRLWIFILAWVFWAYHKFELWLVPDTISDQKNAEMFSSWIAQDSAKFWAPYPERKNRWYTNSVIVSPDYHSKGVGKMMMRTVLEKAQRERVPVGLSASPHGEFLYRRLGFLLLGDFINRIPTLEGVKDEGGGVMCWFPEGWEGRKLGDGEGDVRREG